MRANRPSSSHARARQWMIIVGVLLLAWGLRLCLLHEVPPGWRDDELINSHALSSRVLRGEFPVYYLGASGHEPLYHHLHAGVQAVLGFNVLSGHILSVAFGTLSVALTYVLVRRLFPGVYAMAVVAALTLTTSFWSLMYSRTAIRHISLPPFLLATVYVLWRRLDAEKSTIWGWALLGVLLGATLYTYTASRLLPVLVILLVAYLVLFHRERLRGQWRGMAVAVVVAALMVAPLAVAIAQGRTGRAIEGIGADARVTELARPLRALQEGELEPLVTSIVKTLGMFHASGDPEWLYNIPGRPVFGLLGGTLLWMGVGLCLLRWREPRYVFLLMWLGLGLSPAFVSTPPASVGHTIVAQPVAYILPALALTKIGQRLVLRQRLRIQDRRSRQWPTSAAVGLLLGAFVISNGIRDLRDYFAIWPERGMVRFLYRADQREAAEYLNGRSEITNVAIGSGLMGPWDRVALEIDLEREQVAPRLFNPERALVWTAGEDPPIVLLTSWPDPSGPVGDMLGAGRYVTPHVQLHRPSLDKTPQSLVMETQFENGLSLEAAQWVDDEPPSPGQEAGLLTVWHVLEPLDLPPVPIVAQPPPPKTYSGPRLAVFTHLTDRDGRVLDTDDGLWVDPLTLQPGDRFVQIHHLRVPADSSAEPSAVEVGLYDPKTNRRWQALSAGGLPGADRVRIRLGEMP